MYDVTVTPQTQANQRSLCHPHRAMFHHVRAAIATTAVAAAMDAPAVSVATGFSNGMCEAHPHAGIQTADGGYFMVGDSMCWDDDSAPPRVMFVVKADASGALEWQTALGDLGCVGTRATFLCLSRGRARAVRRQPARGSRFSVSSPHVRIVAAVPRVCGRRRASIGRRRFNYGKFVEQLGDGTLLVAGSASVVDKSYADLPYVERRSLHRLDLADGTVLSHTVYPVASPGDERYGACEKPSSSSSSSCAS